jgi:hypothetical protein
MKLDAMSEVSLRQIKDEGGVAVATGVNLRANSEVRLPAFFYRLSSRAQRTYLTSDSIERFELIPNQATQNALAALMRVLETDNPIATTSCAGALSAEICRLLGAPPVNVEVRGVRPRNTRSELHGLFYPYDPRAHRAPYIVLWMRTAQRHDIVKPKTFVRTLMHEIGHYLDYAALRLEDSYHTQGFFKRESSLVRALFKSPFPPPA